MAEHMIALFQTFPEDTFNLGTVALFASHGNTVHVYYRKIGEELWKKLSGTDTPKPLSEWIFERKTTDPGINFEVYIMAPGNSPIYATV
jgi:hypothetical protein